MVSSLFWFSLPFRLAERSGTGHLCSAASADPTATTWQQLRAEFRRPDPAVPGRWIVLYIDAETGLIDRVHAQLSAPFLRHELWVGQWLRLSRLRRPAGRNGSASSFPPMPRATIVGAMVAEQFVEHVRFNNGYGPDALPQAASGDAARRRWRIGT